MFCIVFSPKQPQNFQIFLCVAISKICLVVNFYTKKAPSYYFLRKRLTKTLIQICYTHFPFKTEIPYIQFKLRFISLLKPQSLENKVLLYSYNKTEFIRRVEAVICSARELKSGPWGTRNRCILNRASGAGTYIFRIQNVYLI